jgi:hypothetical protein
VKQIVRLLWTQKRQVQSCSSITPHTSSKWAFKPDTHSCFSTQIMMFPEPFNQTGWSRTNIVDSYSEGAYFQSRLGQWLSWLRFLWFSSAAPSKCWDSTLISHNNFLPNPFLVIVHQPSYNPVLYSSDTESIANYTQKKEGKPFIINPMASCLNTNTAYYEIRFKSSSISVGGIVTSKK